MLGVAVAAGSNCERTAVGSWDRNGQDIVQEEAARGSKVPAGERKYMTSRSDRPDNTGREYTSRPREGGDFRNRCSRLLALGDPGSMPGIHLEGSPQAGSTRT